MNRTFLPVGTVETIVWSKKETHVYYYMYALDRMYFWLKMFAICIMDVGR